jgi:hypothetical protein
MHINGVGGDCPGKTELHPGVLRGAKVFVEYEPQSRIEGDLQQMPADFAVTELWQVLHGRRRRRDHAGRSPCSTRSALRSRTIQPCAGACAMLRRRLGLAGPWRWCLIWPIPATCSDRSTPWRRCLVPAIAEAMAG